MASVPYSALMKMTMHIDEATLAEVMKITGIKSKTKAVETALKEMARRHKLKAILKKGLGLTPKELKNLFDPASDPDAVVAERPPKYGKSASRR